MKQNKTTLCRPPSYIPGGPQISVLLIDYFPSTLIKFFLKNFQNFLRFLLITAVVNQDHLKFSKGLAPQPVQSVMERFRPVVMNQNHGDFRRGGGCRRGRSDSGRGRQHGEARECHPRRSQGTGSPGQCTRPLSSASFPEAKR